MKSADSQTIATKIVDKYAKEIWSYYQLTEISVFFMKSGSFLRWNWEINRFRKFNSLKFSEHCPYLGYRLLRKRWAQIEIRKNFVTWSKMTVMVSNIKFSKNRKWVLKPEIRIQIRYQRYQIPLSMRFHQKSLKHYETTFITSPPY